MNFFLQAEVSEANGYSQQPLGVDTAGIFSPFFYSQDPELRNAEDKGGGTEGVATVKAFTSDLVHEHSSHCGGVHFFLSFLRKSQNQGATRTWAAAGGRSSSQGFTPELARGHSNPFSYFSCLFS